MNGEPISRGTAEALARAAGIGLGAERKKAMIREGCWFCNGPNAGANKSAEDYWPRWLWSHPKFLETAKKTSMAGLHPRTAVFPDGTGVVVSHEFRQLGRSRIHDKAPGFCRECNNGWMSGIQDFACQHLRHAFHAESGALDRGQQEVLASWITMTAMVIDTHQGETPLIPVEDRKRFYLARTAPDNSSILVARFSGKADNALCWKGGAASLRAGSWLEGWGTSVLAVGDLFAISVFGDRFPLLLSKHLEAMGLQWIHPRTFASINLDERSAIGDGAVGHIGQCFNLWAQHVAGGFKGDLGSQIEALPKVNPA